MRAWKLQATPSWVDMAEIKAFYVEAKRLTKETGVLYSVDHIMPLRHKTSCGLHVPWNLRIMPLAENNAKNNRVVLWP